MVSVGSAFAEGAAIAIVIKGIDNFSSTFKKANTTLGKLGGIAKATAKVMAVAFVGLGAYAIKTASDFETAFIGVRKTTNLTEKEYKDLENRFIDLSQEIPKTFEELSQIGEIAGQLGVTGVDNLTKFTETIARISDSTNLTLEQAATDFARIANVMGEPLENIDRMGAAVVDLGNNFATSEAEIVDMSKRIMGAGKTIGLSTPEVFGMSAALSSLGIRSEMGGSAISRAMITISKSVSEGGEELTNYANVAGMSIDEFSEAWKTKPVEAMSNVIVGLKKVSESGGNTFGVLEDLDLKSIRISDTMLRLSNSEDGITKSIDASIKAWKENKALTEESDKKYASFTSQIDILKNTFIALIKPIGEELIPVILDLAKVFVDDIFPAIKPLIPVIGEFLKNVIEKLAPYLPGIVDKLMKLAEVFMEIFDAIAPLIDPLMELAFVLFDALMQVIEPLIPMIKELVPPLSEILIALTPIITPLAKILTLIVELVSGRALIALKIAFAVITPVIKIFSGVVEKVYGWIASLVEIIKDLVTWINKISLGVLDKIGGVIGKVGGKVGSFFSGSKSVNDAIIRPNGQIIETNPNDTIIATQNPGGISIHIDSIYGLDPEAISKSLSEELSTKISL